MSSKRTWSDDGMTVAVVGNHSIAGVLRQLGMSPTGANYKTVHWAVARLGLLTTHWTGQGHLSGKRCTWVKKKPLCEILVKDSKYRGTSALKKRLMKEGLVENRCFECGQEPQWRGKTLVMVLDHVNGVNNDHRVENLRMLCPNCNSQQDTFAGRNRKAFRGGSYFCEGCGKPLREKRSTGRCIKCCGSIGRKRRKIPDDFILDDVKELGVRGSARKHGVSPPTIARWRKAAVAQLAGGAGLKNQRTKVP